MKLKVFTLRFSDRAGGFNDEPLQDFIADKEVIDFTEHFFVHERTPYLTVLLAYRSLSEDGWRRPARTPDLRNELDENEKEAYDALKAWRLARSKLEGIPPYMIASNKQLAKMVRLRAASRGALSAVEGIGETKSAKYGDEILGLLGKHLMRPRGEPEQGEKEPRT